MKILGIETSCDETAAAVIENGTEILSNVVASSADIHAQTGGVIPESAARQQVKSIIPVIHKALEQAESKPKSIDAIAVTYGPGLIGSLLVGVESAKTLAYLWSKPIVPVNHLIGHIYANFVGETPMPKFPALALVVSGGHTDLILMKNHGHITWIGGTRDDAAGEAFDKTARLLKLPYPGGPNLASLASQYLEKNPDKKLNLFPRPMINEEGYDWSFSGLKTAVLRQVQSETKIDKARIAAETQEAIVDCLVVKALKAIQEFKPKSFLLAGGVAANQRLRQKLSREVVSNEKSTALHVPLPKLCTDNAVYIASSAHFNYLPQEGYTISPKPELTIAD